MPLTPPPPRRPSPPQLVTVAAGTRLFRVHSARFEADAFNFSTIEPPGSGRFDTITAEYGHLYVGDSPEAAVAESLLRRMPLDSSERYILRATLAGLKLSALCVSRDASVVQLHGPGLTRVGQTALLTSCDSAEYGRTREWAARLRVWADEAAGFEWLARHDNRRRAYVFFSDRAEGLLVSEGPGLPLDDGDGLVVVRDALRAHGFLIGR